MHQLLFGVGLIIVTWSPIVAIYGLFTSSPALTIQAFLSFCLGVAYILIRNLVDDLRGVRSNLYRAMNDISTLKREVEALQELPKS